MRIVIIGIGGIGSHLLLPLLQYLKGKYIEVMLVDGDIYETKNKDRQVVPEIGMNKADTTVNYYRNMGFDFIGSIPEYVTPENISHIIREEDIVLLGVDNNATRKLVDIYIQNLENVTLISGGNELEDGNVQVVHIENGLIKTPTLIEQHPEISNPTDRNPDDMSCGELQESQPQISVVNASIADVMRRVLFGIMHDGINYNEVFVNFRNGNIRNVKTEEIIKRMI